MFCLVLLLIISPFMEAEKARLQAEAKAAEEVRRRAEAEAAAEAKRKRELEREAARQALLKVNCATLLLSVWFFSFPVINRSFEAQCRWKRQWRLMRTV